MGGLPIIPFGFPSFVIVDLESEPDFHQTRAQHKRSSKILEEPSSPENEELGRGKKENPMIAKREGLRKKKDKEKTKRMLARLRKPVSRQDEWRMDGHNKTDYMFFDFSKSYLKDFFRPLSFNVVLSSSTSPCDYTKTSA